MAQRTGFALFTALSIAFLAFIANFVLGGSTSTTSTLYCVANPATQHIETLNASLPHAKCFRVQGGMFSEVLAEIPDGSDETIRYLNGWTIPGIIESHGHILHYGEMLEAVYLYDAKSMVEVRDRIAAFLEKHKGEGYGTRKKWIRGFGWDQKYFGGIMPTAAELAADPLLSDLYIMLDRVDAHCILTSQKVLELLPDPLPEAPDGGFIITDPGPGVFCDNAMDYIIFPLAPKPGVTQKTRWFKTAMAELNKVGIIGVGDAGVLAKDIAILEDMAIKGHLSLRINAMLVCSERNTFCPSETTDLRLLREPNGMAGNMLILGGVKIFADGALGSRGAALLDPYSDKPEERGVMLVNETALTTLVHDWAGAGFQVNIHAIGDRANRAAINAFEIVLGKNCNGCNSERRFRIEHAQILHPDDQLRIAHLGIIPSIQPTHATSDMAYAEDRLGSSRLKTSAYRMSSFFPSATYPALYPGPVLGSDFPVEPPNPFHGMYAAVTRLSPATQNSPSGKGGWYPEEKLSVEQALKGFTVNGAYGWFKEQEMGKIEVGKYADWVVLDRDILADKSGESLIDLQVRETWVSGRKVFALNSEEENEKHWKQASLEWLAWFRSVINGKMWWMEDTTEGVEDL